MRVVIRTDASIQIGAGHVMRCLALADALVGMGAEVRFICREHPGHMCRQIAARGYGVTRLAPAGGSENAAAKSEEYAHWLGVSPADDARETLSALQVSGTVDWLVVDHYALDKRWEDVVKGAANRLLVIDDLANRSHSADILVDASYCSTTPSRYAKRVPRDCLLLEGPWFAMLRPEFRRAKARIHSGKIKRLLVFFGSSDLGNETMKAMRALSGFVGTGGTVEVVIGTNNPHRQQIGRYCAARPAMRLHIQTPNMAHRIMRADLAIGAGGVAMWERCSLGLPTIVISCAANQESGCGFAASAGAILYLGRCTDVGEELLGQAVAVLCHTPSWLKNMSEAASELVDGRGAERIAKRLLVGNVTLRPAVAKDCKAVYLWRNALSVREQSLDSEPIPYRKHTEWFKNSIQASDRALLIAEETGKPVGVLRYDRSGSSATVSIYLVESAQGRGLGMPILQAGCTWLAEHWPAVKTLEAVIKQNNFPSIATFTAAGFVPYATTYRLSLEP